MKKFSTASAILALTCSLAGLIHTPAIAANKTKCAFRQTAPDKHVIVKGDTLWDISGKFLANPWCWPTVWGMNRTAIRNPHWIYPGQIVFFDRVAGRLRLGTPTNIKLSPKVRATELNRAISTISAESINPFLSRALIVDENELLSAPRIVAAQEGRVILTKGDRTYVRGDLKEDSQFEVFRPGTALTDPITQEILGYEAAHLGAIKLTKKAESEDEAHSFVVIETTKEMAVGDRLVALPGETIMNYVPHPSEEEVEARILSIYGGVTHAGLNQVVPINRGERDGIDVGTVLTLYRAGKMIEDATDGKRMIKLPDEKYGSLFIFRVFDKLSYGLIMEVTDAVEVGDIARTPE